MVELISGLLRCDFVVACLLVLAAVGARAGETATVAPTGVAPPTGVELEEIVVQPPEPQFVAPTHRDRIGRIWAPVLIDGKGPYRLVLDTGANRTAVTARTAQSLGTAASAEARVTGFTGSSIVPTVHVESIEIGDFSLGPESLPVLADVFGGADGVLSLSGMAHERIFADFVHDRLEIARSHNEQPPPGFDILPLRMVHGLPVINVRIGGVAARAIIDTGAQVSVGNLALRDALARDAPPTAVREDIVGVTLDTQSGDRLPSPDIQFGHLTIRGMNIVFGDMHLFQQWKLTHEPALVISMDLLGSFDVLIIDYARREVQVRPRASPQ